MSVCIDNQACSLCSKCINVCPGDLLLEKDGKVLIRASEECWDCAACVKECPSQAIELYLPTVIGGRGATLQARRNKDNRVWVCKHLDGTKNEYIVPIK
ncbi:indolepyruvate ferredoxin oxidoreductase subunit alpha [Selenihalanaerobacter shriftii]|uniref:Adenylylsulfate reductase subunit B n=1 Tax=Selenihalanaerobacter shriftii TaxID=142842 RepID=A0A1T4LER4_9FIRM|nr:4Fe-4S dicluster domain-containing protein [Selenihalanaerobacter shriftii]SJZ53259.1 adenylylsulfate reductase subunit B [Selenihalanaerobacter shriftii]